MKEDNFYPFDTSNISKDLLDSINIISNWMIMNNISHVGGLTNRKYCDLLEEKLKEKDAAIDAHCRDWADDDTRVKEMCEPIVGKDFIDGADSDYFVSILDVVEEVVKKYNDLKEKLDTSS